MEKKEKLVVVINGKGGVGKDTLCECIGAVYRVFNVSAITPIKEIAAKYGWHGEKDIKARRFLSDLKKAFIDYNDLPTRYLLKEYKTFMEKDCQVMFVHIREGEEIKKFTNAIKAMGGNCITLLIYNDKAEKEIYGNRSDDCVEQYEYDYRYNNSAPLEQSKEAFLEFFREIWNNR